jgi:hypothetical protein
MQNRKLNIGPVALTTTLTTNILNVGAGARATPPVGFTDPQFYALINHVHISNKTAAAATFSLWKGATGANAAGTEFIGTGVSVPANSAVDYYGQWRFDSADFLVGGSGTTLALTITLGGELGAAG